ncbi:MAG: hypothetical protein GY863_03620 [bacterium]|nr:hypothetical protein [bacterium]
MFENIFIYVVFLSQALLISYYFPRKMLSRIKYVFEKYPPSGYPRLYPKPFEYYEKARRNYKYMNLFILIAGLSLMAVMLGYPRSGEWDVGTIVFAYFMLQVFPLMLIEMRSFKYYQLMRQTDSRTTRKAELQPRRLLDFIEPKLFGIAMLVYIAFILFVLYIRQFEYPWFGGIGNMVGVTGINLFFAVIIVWNIYGKKLDPYQAYEDRKRQIELIAKQMVFTSIAATTYIAIDVVIAILDLGNHHPAVMSVYFQVLAVIAFRTLRIDTINFEVYKEEPSLESKEKKNYMMSEGESSHSHTGAGLWIGLCLGLALGVFILIEGGTVKGFVMGVGIGMILGMVLGILLDLRKGTSSAV